MKKFLFFLLFMLLLTSCHANSDDGDVLTGEDFKPVKIALLDTGVSSLAIDSSHILPGYNYVNDTEDTEDLVNHGTAAASVILGSESAGVTGIAPDAYIIPLVIATKSGKDVQGVSPEVLARAIRDSIDIYHADIINVSLGIHSDDSVLREAISYAEEKAIPVISAVGNGGENGRPYYPASYDSVLAVGSCDKDGNRSSFSQDMAQVLAPGEDIMLSSKNGVPYGTSGTSFSTALMSRLFRQRFLPKRNVLPMSCTLKLLRKQKIFSFRKINSPQDVTYGLLLFYF